MAKSKYVSQPDIERRPPSDCAVPAYFVQLLAVKVMDSVIRSNVIFSLRIPCSAQCGLSFSAELRINAEPCRAGGGGRNRWRCVVGEDHRISGKCFTAHNMCDVGSASLYYTGLFRGLREKQGRSRAVPRGVFTYSPTTLKGMSYKLM